LKLNDLMDDLYG